ncbi:MAG: hypothetical protein AB3N13_08745 [Arenibacterium sp.]
MDENEYALGAIRRLCTDYAGSLKAACEKAGIRSGTLNSQLNNGRKVNFEDIVRLAAAWNIPLLDFVSPETRAKLAKTPNAFSKAAARQAIKQQYYKVIADLIAEEAQPSVDDVLDYLHETGFQLSNFDWIRDQVDLFEPLAATDTLMRPTHLGKSSLATKNFNVNNRQSYQRLVSTFDRSLIDSVMAAHHMCGQTDYLVTDVKFDEIIQGVRVQGQYRRIMARVTGEDGNRQTLVYSKRVNLS